LDDHSNVKHNNNRDTHADGHHIDDSDNNAYSNCNAHPDDFRIIKYFTDADDFTKFIGVSD
jgi:hypothetical protein